MSFTKKIILTGTSGQIEQVFLDHLRNSKNNYNVQALDKNKNNKTNILMAKMSYSTVDLQNGRL